MLDKVLRHPLFITIISFFLGSVIYDSLSQKKTREETKLQKKIEFLDQTGVLLNNTLSCVYGVIYDEDVDSNDIENINAEIGNMADNTMRVKIKSEAYLTNKKFYDDYQEIMDELDDISGHLKLINDHRFNETDLKYINERIKVLEEKKWMIPADTITEKESPYKELDIWTNAVWNKSERILSDELGKAID